MRNALAAIVFQGSVAGVGARGAVGDAGERRRAGLAVGGSGESPGGVAAGVAAVGAAVSLARLRGEPDRLAERGTTALEE